LTNEPLLGVALALPVHAARGVVGAASGTVAGALAQPRRVLRRLGGVLDAAETAVVEVRATNAAAAEVVARVDRVVADCRAQVDRSRAALDRYEPAFAAAGPTLAHAATELRSDHVDALARLLDLVPELLDLIVPAFRGLGDLSPELGQLAERFDAVGQIVEGLPGAERLRRRGAEAAEPEVSPAAHA